MFQNYKFSKKKNSVQYLFSIKLLNKNNYTIKNYMNKSYSSFFVNSVSSVNKKWTYLIFSYKEFNSKMLLEFLVTTLNMNSRYSLLFKLGLSENKFLMLGSQIGVIVRDKHNINYYKDIYIRISELIEDYCNSNSTLSKKIRTITILYKELNSSSFLELDLDNIELITENKEKINAVIFKKTSLSKDFSSKYLPLTINSKYYGNLLEGSLKIKYIDKLKSTISSLSGRSIPDYLLNLNLLTVYLRKQGKTGYYLIINKKINSEIENTIYNRYVFSLKTGICLYECTDTIKDTN